VTAVLNPAEVAVGRPLILSAEFVADVRRAAVTGAAYAAAKIGISEKRWMYYPILLERESDPRKIKAYEASLCFLALKQAGVFPAKPAFYREFGPFYVEQVRNRDCIGVFNDSPFIEPEIIRSYRLENKLGYFLNQEPDRSSPTNPELGYLSAFAGKKVLLLSPFAGFLQERANRSVFEAIWSKTGKEWFYPASIEAIEFPYGFAVESQRHYKTALDLLEAIKERIESADFDVALIGVGGLGIPLASFVKNLGKIGLSLGGHLQVLFGVLGDRWRNSAEWQSRYINSAWTDMPAHYRPGAGQTHENYW